MSDSKEALDDSEELDKLNKPLINDINDRMTKQKEERRDETGDLSADDEGVTVQTRASTELVGLTAVEKEKLTAKGLITVQGETPAAEEGKKLAAIKKDNRATLVEATTWDLTATKSLGPGKGSAANAHAFSKSIGRSGCMMAFLAIWMSPEDGREKKQAARKSS
jgi:hypothetical protein